MQIQQLQCNQIYKSDSDIFNISISPFLEGVMIEIFNEELFYFVPFKDVSFQEAVVNRGIVIKALDHMLAHPERAVSCIPDIIDRFNTTEKVSEYFEIQYFPTSINHLSCSFSVKASEIKEGYSELDISVTNYKGKRSVDFCRIQAQDVNDLLVNCERYCSGITELVSLMIAS